VLRLKNSASNEDVHRANIIAMSLGSNQRLLTLCARGILAEWSVHSFELLGVTQLDLGNDSGKIKLAKMGVRYIVVYLPEVRKFRVFDIVTRSLKSTCGQAESKGYVSQMRVLQADSQENSPSVLAYVQGRTVFFFAVEQAGGEHFALRREAKLSCLELAYDDSKGV